MWLNEKKSFVVTFAKIPTYIISTVPGKFMGYNSTRSVVFVDGVVIFP